MRQFGGGRANLTYLLCFGGTEFVLRRPPLGPVAPSSHDMKREHRVLKALSDVFPLAPRSFLHCHDAALIGAEFHVMERRSGIVIRDDLPERLAGRPDLNRRIGNMMIDCLADLHAVDPAAAGLGDLGRPEGFVERQVTGWARRWQDATEEGNPTIDRLIAWLMETRPTSRRVTLLHNDFKLNNILLDEADPGRPTAILDWDMCTRGDPLMDLGHLLNFWNESGDDPAWIAAAPMPTWRPGFPTRQAAVERYARRTGFDVDDVRWYHAFGVFKIAVAVQQIHRRYRHGQTQDARFASYDRRISDLADKAATVAGL